MSESPRDFSFALKCMVNDEYVEKAIFNAATVCGYTEAEAGEIAPKIMANIRGLISERPDDMPPLAWWGAEFSIWPHSQLDNALKRLSAQGVSYPPPHYDFMANWVV